MHPSLVASTTKLRKPGLCATRQPPGDTLSFVASKRVDREIPQSWRDALASHLAAWVETQPLGRRSDRALASALGVSNFTYNCLKNKKGPVGLHVLVTLRKRLVVSVDELLGLPALGVQPPASAQKPADALTADEVRDLKRLTATLRPATKERAIDAPPPQPATPRRRRVLE